VRWTATISIFLSASKCGSVCRAQTCAHSGIEPSRSAKALIFYRVGHKVKKSNFSPFRKFYVHISQNDLIIKAYKQRTEKALSLPYLTVDRSIPIAHGVLQGGPKIE